jgi:hypothetical protein
LLRRTIEASSTHICLRATISCQAENLTKETSDMSIHAHLAELVRRHQALEIEIAEALQHPSIDDLQIAELKRRKLQVKDEIARLSTATIH